MKVHVSDLNVSMDLGNKGITLAVYDNSDKYLGKLIIGKAKVTWCHGKTTPENGKILGWNDFIKLMDSAK